MASDKRYTYDDLVPGDLVVHRWTMQFILSKASTPLADVGEFTVLQFGASGWRTMNVDWYRDVVLFMILDDDSTGPGRRVYTPIDSLLLVPEEKTVEDEEYVR